MNISLSSMINSAYLTDKDGSESLFIEINDLPADSIIYELDDNGEKNILTTNSSSFKKIYDDKFDYYFIPPKNFSGSISLTWRAIAMENLSSEESILIKSNIVNIIGKADQPLPIKSIDFADPLIEGKSINLDTIINTNKHNQGLILSLIHI